MRALILGAVLAACSSSSTGVEIPVTPDAGEGGAPSSGGTGGNSAGGADAGAESGGAAPGAGGAGLGGSDAGGAPAGGAGGNSAGGNTSMPGGTGGTGGTAGTGGAPPTPDQCPGPEWDPYGSDYWIVLELEPGQCVESERTFSGNLVQYAHSLPDGRCYSVAVNHLRVQAPANAALTLHVHFNGAIAETDRRILPCQ